MNDQKTTKVIFLKVSTNEQKLQRLSGVVHYHFQNRDKFLIMVPSASAATFLDQLLWQLPEESFTPHSISSKQCNDPVVITTTTNNLNHAQILLNLSPLIPPNIHDFSTVYELLDFTHPTKEEQSLQKKAEYEKNNFSISIK